MEGNRGTPDFGVRNPLFQLKHYKIFYEEGEFTSGLRMAVTKGVSSTGD
jgi:hypothetical protein